MVVLGNFTSSATIPTNYIVYWSTMAKSSKQQILSLNDLGTILTELHPARTGWYNIGLQLLLPVTDLQCIESEYKNDHDSCLRQMLIKWLEMGTATWETLTKALQAPIVQAEGNMARAENLQKKYCGEGGEEESHGKGKKRKISETATPGGATPSTKVHEVLRLSKYQN